MNSKALIKKLFEELNTQVSGLSESDLLKIEEGTHELTIKVTKKKSQLINIEELSTNKKEEILKHLQEYNSREDGIIYITEALKNKKELEQFAKFLDVLVSRQDKVDQIKDKIIEATIGAMLRSNAIQGKNITKKST